MGDKLIKEMTREEKRTVWTGCWENCLLSSIGVLLISLAMAAGIQKAGIIFLFMLRALEG